MGVDRWLIIGVILLSLFGILMVYDSSVAIAIRDFSDQYYFVKEQLKWLVVGYVAFGIFSFLDYRLWYKFALPMLIGSLVLLLAVFIPGLGVRALGAHRWINFGFFVLQPAELAKLVLVMYLSAWFSTHEKRRLAAFILLLGMMVGLVLLEPDLGTGTILLSIAILLYFFSGAPIYHFLLLIPILLGSVGVLAIISPYRMQRMLTFLNPQHDPLGASYQIRQVLLSLGSGGWFGVGIGQSRQKYEYLPEANTDSIFAIIGEEVGFIGAAATILLFLFIVWRGFRIAKRTSDPFGRLLALGISSWIAVQTAINLCAMVALIPLTGVPLPFVSYGGSSLIIILVAAGILANISKNRS
ncbi:cell division protein FtsW [Candidatus Gottesmanbacteria bacterium RBG_13_45_10]|uniref:Probable peptidoglycan glycosyltransferase FtsW n=1 Tax=Candidatus Gottesmanbacteria bacterium RBG_13_45_10 TaxID=1798370 RepID=A0A1F5ZGT5_9BACT|nr:MAG: cell division protein FtsW [Candidatus Gottesmanbacteria bacterium RBG_13_45_10]